MCIGEPGPYSLEMRPNRCEIGMNPYIHLFRFAGFKIVDMKRSELLVYDGSRARGRRLDIQAVVLDQLLDLLGSNVIAEQRHRAPAIRQEVDLVAYPHRVKVF